MQEVTEGREHARQAGDDDNATSSEFVAPPSPKSASCQTHRESVACCDAQESSARSTGCARVAGIEQHDECTTSERCLMNSDKHDPPPPYAEAVYEHKNPPHHAYELHNVNNTHQTREVLEAEAIASDNRRKYRQREKGCKRFTMIALFLFAFAGFYLMHWHKQLAVRFARNQDEALRNIVYVANTSATKPYEGQLVHAVGPLTIGEPLTDPECGFAVSSVKLKRFVHNSEIYMMVKTKQDCKDPTETEPRYYYTRKGGDILLNANQMCVNPRNMFLKRWDIKDQIQTARVVKIGSLTLGPELKEQFDDYVYVTDKLMELRNDNAVRLMFSYAGKEGDTYTVIGKLAGGVVVPYRTAQGDEILMKRMYAITAEEMIRLRQFDSNFEFYRRCYVISFIATLVTIAFVYYYKIHPLRPRENR